MTALPIRHGLACAVLALCFCLPAPSVHTQPAFGDNSSKWANDGECDDPRFEGEGSATTLLEEDRGHDATNCRTLLEQGRIALRAAGTDARMRRGRLEKGDNTLRSGEYADEYTFTGSMGQRAVVD